ncbi:hypothetical protein Dform_00332 [Dehalogenimonas formicexedens]|uniref:Uncharacterized protein n=2 Tax=Dehalogenimonas formicexedens TaxID=1839801 RepID=A0A1P8F5R6_9CHLR|nr:hypothetical protein Dform_00332 [Dehalogenimonas formicexedens]
MCFSAVASFTGGAVISGVGIAAQRERIRPEQRLFASIPLIFALQQFAEGVLWLTLRSGGHIAIQNTATYVFLTVALAAWPTLVPLSVLLMEKVKARRIFLAFLVAAGGIVSVLNAYSLLNYPVTVQIQGSHIQYNNSFPTSWGLIPILYGISVILPLWVSSVKHVWLLGLAIAVSLMVTVIFYTQYVTSVWCFFAALMSVIIIWILRTSRNSARIESS